jgi:hypothetical protein
MSKKRIRQGRKGLNESEFEEHLDRVHAASDKILELTTGFCQKYLNEDYRELCEDLTWAVYEEGLPLDRGKPAGWASGVVHAAGWVNFLHDPGFLPCMTSHQIAERFGVSQATMLAKSRIIRDELDLIQMDPDWCLPSLLKDNPLVWMLDVDGLLMDARYLPREMQEQAYERGLIPYVPADQQEPDPDTGTNAKIIEFPAGQNKTTKQKSSQQPRNSGPSLFDELGE